VSDFSRPINAGYIGTTARHRNPAFLSTLVQELVKIPSPRVLVHGCSIGYEPLSLAEVWLEHGSGGITIEATDIEPSFLEQAPKAPASAAAHRLVRWLPPASCVTYTTAQVYDAVVCMNVLCYLSEEDQHQAIWKMASIADRYLCLTAGTPHVVKEGILEAGLMPLWRNWLPIYYGWHERLSWGYRKVWKLPRIPFLLPHWRYAGTSIFVRPDTKNKMSPNLRA